MGGASCSWGVSTFAQREDKTCEKARFLFDFAFAILTLRRSMTHLANNLEAFPQGLGDCSGAKCEALYRTCDIAGLTRWGRRL